eukprot:TRINITY_DN3779_c0_g1_i6.p1 TRINITY_DN3779_c0_g1~~TRINITY_DN3779_c0_g1_i6.p1  ORF type:complete len:150 (+),score=52.19 TRINITY_DN3779_c0_g1_i6:69-452(+)
MATASGAVVADHSENKKASPDSFQQKLREVPTPLRQRAKKGDAGVESEGEEIVHEISRFRDESKRELQQLRDDAEEVKADVKQQRDEIMAEMHGLREQAKETKEQLKEINDLAKDLRSMLSDSLHKE